MIYKFMPKMMCPATIEHGMDLHLHCQILMG